eukprot:CAMPEP_0177674440 /NCGR_PEP_ID=MMETSP0447-20121125/26557_1 /TAXON_ID=0 /ORGANISM="Stygamoeba regulata, Strain BSH-02190019" /LENGTH=48 /DNA_ID= /DNA_START= /DNA_END= /DNA_ORIENTATION=
MSNPASRSLFSRPISQIIKKSDPQDIPQDVEEKTSTRLSSSGSGKVPS